MKKTSKVALSALAVCGAGLLAIYSCNADTDPLTAELQLTINPGTVTIGINDDAKDINLGTVEASFDEQTLSGTFADQFWLQDLKGASSGYYTTLQASNLTSTTGNFTIAASNVKLLPNALDLITGATNEQVKAPTTELLLGSAQTYINRAKDTDAGVLSKYGTTPKVTVVIPANQSAGQYTGTITYTLYDEAQPS